MMTGSDGVSFLLPQLFLSQHRLQSGEVGGLEEGIEEWGGVVSHRHVSNRESRDEVANAGSKGRGSRETAAGRRRGDYEGRESFDLDFCGASRGKTPALGLQ